MVTTQHSSRAERRRESINAHSIQLVADAERKKRARALYKAKTPYPKAAVHALKAIFDEYDADGDGTIDRHELTGALEKKKQDCQRIPPRRRTLAERQAHAGRVNGQSTESKGVFLVEFADALFDALDANSDSRVDFAEVLRIVYPLAKPEELRTMVEWVTPVPTEDDLEREEAERLERERMNELRRMFAAYDRDKDGKVSITEFRMAMLDHDNWDEVDELFDIYDSNGNGEVDFDEFCAIVSPEPDE